MKTSASAESPARGLALSNRYVAMVHRAVIRDARVYSQFLRVLNLLDPPGTLFRPAIMLRVLQGKSSSPLLRRAGDGALLK